MCVRNQVRPKRVERASMICFAFRTLAHLHIGWLCDVLRSDVLLVNLSILHVLQRHKIMREFDPTTNIYGAVLIYAQRRFSARHFAEEERRTDASPYSI